MSCYHVNLLYKQLRETSYSATCMGLYTPYVGYYVYYAEWREGYIASDVARIRNLRRRLAWARSTHGKYSVEVR